MKHSTLYFLLLILFCFYSCEKEAVTGPQVEISNPNKIKLYYSGDAGKSFAGTYEAVRIGEYWWMNNNFNHLPGFEDAVTRAQLDKVLNIYYINPQLYPITIADFNKYYGHYYSQDQLGHICEGKMYEGDNKRLELAWMRPTKADFRQLFAMCGNASEEAVRTTLTCKAGENPVAIGVPGTYWFGPLNTNRYGFNLLPGGARFHNTTSWRPHAGTNEPSIVGEQGDFYGFFQSAVWTAQDGTVSIHDYPDTSGPKLWHLMPMRWCKRLTDKELGYKLYINAQQTDIVKLNLTEPAPNGYSELPKGYIRGFYVQYILDNLQPEKTVTEILNMAKNLR